MATCVRSSACATGDQKGSLFGRLQDDAAFAATDGWIVESHAALHDLVLQTPSSGDADPRAASREPRTATVSLTGLSYERLLPYRDVLMRALFSKVQTGVESPQAFAAYARSLTLAPEPGALPNPDAIVQAFVRDVLLTGNGTLFVNNTFVEWAAVQALRRAQPRLLVTRYGVRDKLKPFSSLLLFSQPRTSDQIPLIEDPVGSFIDVEQLSYYVWVQAEKSAAYRRQDAVPVPRRKPGRAAGDSLGHARSARVAASRRFSCRRLRHDGAVAWSPRAGRIGTADCAARGVRSVSRPWRTGPCG